MIDDVNVERKLYIETKEKLVYPAGMSHESWEKWSRTTGYQVDHVDEVSQKDEKKWRNKVQKKRSSRLRTSTFNIGTMDEWKR